MKLTLIPILVIAVFLCACQQKAASWELESPGGQLKIVLSQRGEEGAQHLQYQVFMMQDGSFRAIMDPSMMGIDREDGKFSKNLEFMAARESLDQVESYNLLSGKQLEYHSMYNALELNFRNADKQKLVVTLRAFDEGIAFRYTFPESTDHSLRVIRELTSFDFMEGKFWAHPYDTLTKYTPAYETYYTGPMPLGTPGPDGKNGWAFPLLVESEEAWILVSEAGFDGSYGASHLDANCAKGNYQIRFAEPGEAEGFYEHTSHAPLPWSTPWRFLAIGDNPSTVVETTLPTDLAVPCKVEDLSWIEPGRASWSWWSDSDSPQDFDRLVPFVDMAAEMGWEYSLVDANWNEMKNGSLEDLAIYAKKKGVGLLLWYNSGGKHNIVEEAPRDLMFQAKARKQEFERISKMGIRGIKVDFFQSDKQEIIKQYIGILEDAAASGLLVNFHGCTLPKGWRRTWPNLLTMESVRGGESYKFDANFPLMAPPHLTIVPYTRNAVGPCDYTTGGFSHHTYPHLTTHGFELALPVVIESGIMHHMDTPELTLSLPPFAVEYLKEIPVCWNETRYISGYPGKEVVLARRKGDRWYLAGINGEDHAKELSLNLLKTGSRPERIVIYSDGDQGNRLQMTEIHLAEGKLDIHMEPYGGFVGIW